MGGKLVSRAKPTDRPPKIVEHKIKHPDHCQAATFEGDRSDLRITQKLPSTNRIQAIAVESFPAAASGQK